MTKMKSKKMTKSTFAIIIMGIVMVAMLAFGGTFAYFTASATKAEAKDIKTAYLQVKENTVTKAATTNVVPGDTIVSGATFKTDSNVATYAVVKFTVTFGGAEVAAGAADSAVKFTMDATQGWVKSGNYYVTKVAAGTKGTDTTINVCGAITFDGKEENKEVDEDTVLTLMDKEIVVTLESWSIQQAHLTGIADPSAALTETDAASVITALGLGA